ncbi:possible tRNA synthetases class I [Synechococcus sp. CC9311]|nr:possible tRNA synthetases class I [Synechococcus sp. CC9311]
MLALVSNFNSRTMTRSSDKFDDEHDARHLAISRLSRKRAYRHQVINYLWVNGLLIVVWCLTGFGFFWPIYPLLGWGGALLIQGWKITHPHRHSFSEAEINREINRI